MSKVLTRPLRVLIQGKDKLGKAKYVNVTESGDLRVQLSGKKVLSITMVDNLEIRDTLNYDFSTITSEISGMSIVLVSSLNAELSVRFNPYGLGYQTARTFNGVEWSPEETVIIPSSPIERRYYLNTAFPYIDNLISPRIGMRISAKTAPTQGRVSVFIFGGVN